MAATFTKEVRMRKLAVFLIAVLAVLSVQMVFAQRNWESPWEIDESVNIYTLLEDGYEVVSIGPMSLEDMGSDYRGWNAAKNAAS